MPTERLLHGKTAWISGASRGIGRAVAFGLARAGAIVVLGARTEAEIRQNAEIIRSEGGKAHAVPLDVSQPESIAAFEAAAVELAGPPNLLINNAGVGVFRDIEAMDPATFEQQIAVGLRGPWYMMRAAVPHMKRFGSGHIVNVTSIAGRVGFKRGSAYCAAKAGLNMMSEALMLELREFGIKVTVVAPGSVDTGFHRIALPNQNQRNTDWMLEPETVADAIVHLVTMPPGALPSYYEIRPLETGP